MENMRRWINYDWFKLIVALILLVIFIVLLRPPVSVNGTGAPVAAATNPADVAPAASPTVEQPQASPTATQPTATVVQPTATAVPPTPTLAPSPTPEPQPTATPTPAPAAEQAQPAAASGDCSQAIPTRLDVGKKAKVTLTLYLREAPGMDKKILLTNPPGASLEITGGPACVPLDGGTYRWWNVMMDNGTAGWSAEGSLFGKTYFMEPVP